MNKKIYTLKNTREFNKVYKEGKNYWNRNLILYILKNDLGYNRVGYSITKKIGNSVTRNKIRRRMKEIYRLDLQNLEEGYDLVFIPKRNVVDISFWELKSAMEHILSLTGIRKVR